MILPIMKVARAQFLEEWRNALDHMDDDEARLFVFEVQKKMREMAITAAIGREDRP